MRRLEQIVCILTTHSSLWLHVCFELHSSLLSFVLTYFPFCIQEAMVLKIARPVPASGMVTTRHCSLAET